MVSMSTGFALHMPSAQQRLPTETSKGTNSSVSTFSINPLSEFVVRAGRPWLARLASVIQFRRTGDMTKPGNLGAPQPMNTLSNNSASSRMSFGIPSSSRSTLTSPPPAKREKPDESNINSRHSRATFALLDVVTPRKRSIGSASVTDSQSSAASNMSSSPPMVAKYRSPYGRKKPARARKRRSDRKLQARKDVESLASRSIPPLIVDDDISEDDVDLINPSKELTGSHQLKRKQPEKYSISEFADRFQRGGTPAHSNPSEIFAKTLDNVDQRMKSQQSGFSPDELAPSEEELAASRPIKRRKALSASLSKRGNILPTVFKGAFTARTPARLPTIMDEIVKQKGEAATIIGDGLRIVRGASGQCQYQAEHEEDPDVCLLSIRELGHTLFPVDQNKNILKPYRYLTLDIMNVKTILRCRDDNQCCIATIIFDSLNLSSGAGLKLMIEFASVPEFCKFLQWVALYDGGRNCRVTIQDCNRAKLEKDFDEIMRRAKSHRILSDLEIAPSVANADDIQVIQHNRNNRSLRDHDVVTEARSQPRLRDAMKSSPASRSNGNGIVPNQVWDDQLASVQQQTRTTRTSYECIESREPDPIPEGWTLLNAGWEKRWRNSLVYPSTGKNRATVDKDDIQRLDEGQFLNDNIIIFYLRFLEKSLEDENKDLAKRIYFQNTFFYDKLKPTRNGQGINYDSVKTWTSKVDLFSKDYIIVPINEYTHWYVAIICNVSKLVPSSGNHEQDGDMKDEVIAIADGNGITQGNSQAHSRNGVPNGGIDGQHVALPAQENVVESLRRMSIDSSGHPSGVTQQKADNNAEEGVESFPLRCDHDVYEVKNSDKPEAEVEYIATAANPQPRRKVGKKPSAGLRKVDPTQPRIITLDSLGAAHSPTCSYLKQYLIAELRDKRGIEIASPGAMGTTAKDVPEQTNHCDCGLFLLGYIQEFLRGPDSFVKSLLQRDGKILWDINPSKLRNNIRDLIFQLQGEQQNAEDVAKDRKRQGNERNKKQTKAERALSYTAAPAMNLSNVHSEMELASQDCHDDEEDKSKTPPALPHPRPFGSRTGSTSAGETMDRKHVPDSEAGAKHAITNVQPSAPSAQNSNSRATRQAEMGDGSNVEEMQAGSKATQHVVVSPRKIEPTLDHEIYQVLGTSPISPVRTKAARRCSTSPETEGSTNPQSNFLAPLASETPSSKSSRGVTPLDPVLVDDSDNNRREKPRQTPPGHRGGQAGRVLVVEIPSSNMHSQSLGRDGKTDGQKQVGQQSPYFLNRRDGERVVAAKIREKPPNDVIDLSGD